MYSYTGYIGCIYRMQDNKGFEIPKKRFLRYAYLPTGRLRMTRQAEHQLVDTTLYVMQSLSLLC